MNSLAVYTLMGGVWAINRKIGNAHAGGKFSLADIGSAW